MSKVKYEKQGCHGKLDCRPKKFSQNPCIAKTHRQGSSFSHNEVKQTNGTNPQGSVNL
jgi:hypothetical protein